MAIIKPQATQETLTAATGHLYLSEMPVLGQDNGIDHYLSNISPLVRSMARVE